MMETEKTKLEFIKKILNNFSLLKWVKKFSADGLQEEDTSKTFEVETCEDSISIADTSVIKMFFSASRFCGETYASFDIKQIKEVLSLIEGDGKLIINENDEKRFCYIESDGNVVVIAPYSESEKARKKASKKKVDKPKKEVEEEIKE